MGLVLRALDRDGIQRALSGGKPFFMGRGPDNDWVLDDPAREISKVHCRIDGDGRAHLITDLSINGVHLEREGRVLGRGNRHRLAPGDVFAVGPHRFAVVEAGDAGTPAAAPAVGAVGDILGGHGAGAEPRASAALSGEAKAWLDALPVEAAATGLARPLGWDDPPPIGGTILPADVDGPASPLADAAEHAPATSSALHAPRAAQTLPADWLDEPAGRPEPAAAPDSRDAPARDAGAARRALAAGARVEGAALSESRDPVLFARAGALVRTLVDGLDILEAAQAVAEHDCGIAPTAEGSLWSDVLSEARDPCVKLLSDGDEDALGGIARRFAALADRQRALGGAVADAAAAWDRRLDPRALAAAGMPWFAAGPFARAALWDRYADAHATLRREGAGAGRDGGDHPLVGLVRRAFSRRLSGS